MSPKKKKILRQFYANAKSDAATAVIREHLEATQPGFYHNRTSTVRWALCFTARMLINPQGN